MRLAGIVGFVLGRRACPRNRVGRLYLRRLLFHYLCQGKDLGVHYELETLAAMEGLVYYVDDPISSLFQFSFDRCRKTRFFWTPQSPAVEC